MVTEEQADEDGLDDYDRTLATEMDARPIYPLLVPSESEQPLVKKPPPRNWRFDVPTKEEITILKERLDAMRYTVFECAPGQVPKPVDSLLEESVIARGHRDSNPNAAGWTTWDRLSNDERRAMLIARVDWQGFHEQQKHRIIERVLRYGNPDEWFGGIEPSIWTKGAALAKSLKEQARIAGERYKGGE